MDALRLPARSVLGCFQLHRLERRCIRQANQDRACRRCNVIAPPDTVRAGETAPSAGCQPFGLRGDPPGNAGALRRKRHPLGAIQYHQFALSSASKTLAEVRADRSIYRTVWPFTVRLTEKPHSSARLRRRSSPRFQILHPWCADAIPRHSAGAVGPVQQAAPPR